MDYKKILEGVVNIINTTEKSDIGFINICTYIGENCPELKESEDEKIRKELIAFLKENLETGRADETWSMSGLERWIAWLEKQGNKVIDCSQNHKDMNNPNGCIVLEDFNGGDGFYKVHLDYLNKKQVEEVEEMVRAWNKESNTSDENIKSCIGICLTDADEQRFKDFGTSLKECLAWLEKQGDASRTYELGFTEGQRIERKWWLEKQGEQKPVAIPKFRVGDFVKDANYHGEPTYEIVGMDGECYICQYRGNKSMGDRSVMHFCFDNPYLRLVEKKPVDLVAILKDYFATTPKEQQDKDWEELKHLNNFGWKLVEQKPIKTCAEYYNKDSELKMPELSEFQNKLADILMHREYDGPDETEDDIAKGRLEYELAAIRLSEELLPLAQKEQKPTWSEEDETIIDNLVLAIANDRIRPQDRDDYCDWLKDLKDRVHPQPKQEWSEEDEKSLCMCLGALGNPNYCYEDGDLERMRNWLKSLKPQNGWKPSDEQMKVLDVAIKSSHLTTAEYNGLVKLREQLKRL